MEIPRPWIKHRHSRNPSHCSDNTKSLTARPPRTPSSFFLFFFSSFFFFLEPHLWHMEVPRLGGESELQLPAYTTAIATWGLSCICDLYHSSRQCQILKPTGQGQGLNLCPHGYWLGSLPLSHHGNSLSIIFYLNF